MIWLFRFGKMDYGILITTGGEWIKGLENFKNRRKEIQFLKRHATDVKKSFVEGKKNEAYCAQCVTVYQPAAAG